MIFCPKCGRALKDGDVCPCSASSSHSQIKQPTQRMGMAGATPVSPYVNRAPSQAGSAPVVTDEPWRNPPTSAPAAPSRPAAPLKTAPASRPAVPSYPSPAIDDEPWKKEIPVKSEPVKKAESDGFSVDQVKDTAKSLWAKFKNRVGLGDPETNGEGAFERGKMIVPECVKADDGEIPIRQYRVADLRTVHKLHWAEGRLQVTNKRVIFRAPGRSIMGKTILQHEFAIEEIAGIEARKEPRLSIFELLIGFVAGFAAMGLVSMICAKFFEIAYALGLTFAIITMLSGAAPTFFMYKKFFLKMLCVAGACSGSSFVQMALVEDAPGFGSFLSMLTMIIFIIDVILYALKTNLVLTIKTKGATEAVEIRRKKKKGILGFLFPNNTSEKEDYTGFSDVLPAQETEKAIREVWAMVSDIQKRGDYGVEKWKDENVTE